jgi:N-acetylmuramoyl-L-alanine amidase
MKYVVLDPGHGGKDPGASGYGIYEKNVVLDLAKRVNTHLGAYENVAVSLTRWDDRFIELSDRAKFANNRNADLFVSLHNNAASASAHGFESFVYTSASSASRKYQDVVHSHIMAYLKNYGITDRGKKSANYAVVRETKMPAMLIEYLFITNSKENSLLKDSNFLDGLAKATAEGIAAALGLKKKSNKPEPPYRVVVDGVEKVWTAYDSKVLDAVADAIKDNRAKNIQIERIDR